MEGLLGPATVPQLGVQSQAHCQGDTASCKPVAHADAPVLLLLWRAAKAAGGGLRLHGGACPSCCICRVRDLRPGLHPRRQLHVGDAKLSQHAARLRLCSLASLARRRVERIAGLWRREPHHAHE